MTTILLDNTSPDLYAPDWVTIPTGQGTLGGSVSRANSTKDLTSFEFTFNGSHVDVYIVVSPFDPPKLTSDVTIRLDERGWTLDAWSSYGEAHDHTWSIKWFSAPVPEGQHTISVTNFPPQFSLDYITVFTTHELSSGWYVDVIIQDDKSNSIEYTGQWDSVFDTILSAPLPSSEDYVVSPLYLNTAHSVIALNPSVKTSATYHFVGTSVFVYGVLDAARTAEDGLTVAFIVDGSEMKRTYLPGSELQANFLWFGSTALPFTSHTLQIEVLELNGVEFILDYIIYNSGLSTRPNYGRPGQLSPPFSSRSAPEIPERPDWSLPNATTAETWGYTQVDTESNQVSKSTIIGASVGVVGALLVIVAVLIFWLRYRTRRNTAQVSKNHSRDGRLPHTM